jgi:toxin ParE1/3/4
VLWTPRARQDLASIRDFVARDSPCYAVIVIERLIAATERLARFPESGRPVLEVRRADFREIIHAPYRIVYRLVGPGQVHIVTVHHGTRGSPRLP